MVPTHQDIFEDRDKTPNMPMEDEEELIDV